MNTAHDLMERVAAVDPVRDPSSLAPEEQREADALLERLLATPVAPDPRVGRPRRRRWPQLAAATVAVAVAAFAAASLLGSDEGPARGVIAKAVAALTQHDAVYHAEFIAHYDSSFGPEPRTRAYFDTWHTTGGRMRQRSYVERDGGKGRLVGEFAGQLRPGRRGGPALSYDARENKIMQMGFGFAPSAKGAPGVNPFDPGRSLREAQAAGRLRVAGRVELDGRPAYRLVSGTVSGSGGDLQRTVLVVDAETYLPREQRLFLRAPNGERYRIRWHYVVYERLPLNDETESLLDFDPPPGAKCEPGTDKLIRKGSLGFPNPCAR
jgi:hypothetical protein